MEDKMWDDVPEEQYREWLENEQEDIIDLMWDAREALPQDEE